MLLYRSSSLASPLMRQSQLLVSSSLLSSHAQSPSPRLITVRRNGKNTRSERGAEHPKLLRSVIVVKLDYLWLLRLGTRVRFTKEGRETLGRVIGWSRCGLDLREMSITVVSDSGANLLLNPQDLRPVTPLEELGYCATNDDTCLDDSSQ